MDNKEINEKIAQRTGLKADDVQNLQDGLIDVIKDSLAELDSVAIPSFGTFEAKKKNERVVTNPSNGKRMLLPPKITMSFKVSNVLKSKLK